MRARASAACSTPLTCVICSDVPGVGAYYVTFEAVKRILARDRPGPLSAPSLLFAGAMGGVGFWTFALPFDTIKSVVQTDASATMTGAMANMWAEGGVKRLYRGATVAFGRGIPGAAVTFYTYTTVAAALGAR